VERNRTRISPILGVRRWRSGGLLCLAGLGALPCVTASAQPFPPSPPDRRETVSGWRVEHVGDEEMGRDVRMTLDRDGFSILYYANYWHGNGGAYRGVRVERRGESCGGEEWRDEPPRGFRAETDVAGDSRRLRTRLIRYLAQCNVGARQAEPLLRGFTPVFARMAVFAEQARRRILAVGCSIEHYPEGERVVRRLCHRR
jgi:hypothetical protein